MCVDDKYCGNCNSETNKNTSEERRKNKQEKHQEEMHEIT